MKTIEWFEGYEQTVHGVPPSVEIESPAEAMVAV